MTDAKLSTAVIVGAGSGLSASLARALAADGVKVALAARSTDDLADLSKSISAPTFACDASQRDAVEALFTALDRTVGAPEIVVYNASYRTRGPVAELDPVEVEKALMVSAYGGFLVGQQAVKRMLPKKRGAILFTGASASVKGYAQSAPFAMGKFALRGLAQSMARELHPQRAPARACGQTGKHARSRRDRADISASAPAAAQRLVVGDRGAPLGGIVLRRARNLSASDALTQFNSTHRMRRSGIPLAHICV
jgi:NAD(P)-dependent dehydrogenase (short-subunit alcohol dehydrogenase family)